MSTEAAARGQFSPFEQLRFARQVLRQEAQAVVDLAGRLDDSFSDAVQRLHDCAGCVIVTGMGKAGHIGRKLSATFASTGSRSHFLHPGEAFHGDLGRVHRSDVVLALSRSGETEEVIRLLPALADFGVEIIAVTARPESTLARAAAVTLDLGPVREVCSLGLAPSASTTAMLALGDALALVVSHMRGFGADDFARFHPGGSLGLQLARVNDHMRPLGECRVARDELTVRSVFAGCTLPGRRTGAIMLVGEGGRLTGLFTDSDLARLFEQRRDAALDGPIADVMTRSPTTIALGSLMSDAVQTMAGRKISELPVIDDEGKPAGLLDITDVASLWPEANGQAGRDEPAEEPQILPYRPPA